MYKLLVKLISNKVKYLLEVEEVILLVKLDKTTYANIEELVKKGNYLSIENFTQIAVKNQLLLETEGRIEVAGRRRVQRTVRTERPPLSTILRTPKKAQVQELGKPLLDESIRNAPVWGQINRLAPAKLVLRTLLSNLSASKDRSADLRRFSAEVAEQATKFRRFAKKNDKMRRVRGEGVYVGFPKKDPSSQQRFLNYYVGKGPLKKWTDSIITGLSLGNIQEMEDGSTVIGLTEAGLKFALLHSPLIDDFFLNRKQIDAPLSSDEVSFLMNHIKSVRPREYEFLVFILRSIKKGDDTPTKLQSRIFDYLQGIDLQIKLSAKVANTMQVGAIGRLVEMRLVKIEKQAQKSKYSVTERGEKLVGKL
jgi:hypothetical protein